MCIAKCCHEGCSSVGTVKIEANRRGGRAVYLCEYHARVKESYFHENNIFHGVDKVCKNTFGCEFETSFSTEKARAEFILNKYEPTADSTVDVEYKSPIMKGLNSFSKQCETYEKLIQSGDLRVDSNCGTHFHFGDENFINNITIDYVRRFVNSLFVPLSLEIEAHPEETKKLFGRNFNMTEWAIPITEASRWTEHKNFINLEHSNTLEFRLCKFDNANQMITVAKCIKEMGNTIIKNFIMHFNDAEIDMSRYPTIKEYRKHKANVTAKKLVKIYRKYAGLD